MEDVLIARPSDSLLVKAVTHWVIGDHKNNLARPDGCWDIVVFNMDGRITIMLTGQTTQAVSLPFSAGDEILTISFKPSSFLTCFPATELLDKGEILPTTANRFQLGSDLLEIPTFENADTFVKRLYQKGILQQDEIVEELLNHRQPAYSLRSVQRRFLRTTGMPPNKFSQIQRAQQAATLLQTGMPAIQVAYETGYADQPHMSRSLKYILGQTPSEIISKPGL